MSHSPLLNLPGPSQDLLDDIDGALAQAREFVEGFDPELVVIFAPDHYNGFFYKLMPPFCIGTEAQGVGDYGTHKGPLDVPEATAVACAKAVLSAGVDIAISANMDVDHGTVQPLEKLFGRATARPVIPIFINSVATPLGPLHRCRTLGTAVGSYLATLNKRVLVMGSGGLSHDPPVPTLATATPAVVERIVHGRPMTPEQRLARQTAVMDAARSFANGKSELQPLNPAWDHRFLDILDSGELDELDKWSNSFIAQEGGNSAHEIRTWVAAFAALASAGPYQTARALLPAGRRVDRRLRGENGGAGDMTSVPPENGPGTFDHVVDVLVIGSGGGGMTAALAAHASGLETLVVEKSGHFGGSTALSGGGIWVPGAPAQRRAGYAPPPDGVVDYLRRITDGPGQRRANPAVRRLGAGNDGVPRTTQPVVRVRLEARLCRLLSGIAGWFRTRQHDQRSPDRFAQRWPRKNNICLLPLALAPRGIWLGPKELRSFYQVRQSWAGKGVLVKLVWRMVRARVFGDRIAAIGQSLAARLRLAMKDRGIPLWLDSPMTELLTDDDGR